MLTRLLIRLRLRSAARRYARELGPRLRRDYGAGSGYTPAQIRTAAQKCRLPLAYLSIGYAAFLGEAAYREVADAAWLEDHAALRTMFRAHLPHGLRSAGGDAEVSLEGIGPSVDHTD